MTDVSPMDVPTRRNGIREEQVEGELLLYVPADTRAIYLNPTAAVIWALCDGVRSMEEISAILVENYPDAQASISAEVADTLVSLRDAQALTIPTADSRPR